MRTKEELQSKEFNTNLETLHRKLLEEGIEHIYKQHPAVGREPQVLDLIGYFPTGTHQILIGDGDRIGDQCVSIIRGFCSFGDFELYGNQFNVDRFETEEEVIKALKASSLKMNHYGKQQ